ncbi:type II toxin-antitoxin system RelE/ParE family toxin [Enterobacteriaceae bacterium 155047]|uniref:type II toxin-antitoxin system RelE/ParE family toxin n=1 Tax=Huaxiibacter chinensis TaxID=2899785 RepID=UPI0007DA7B7D|nr:type II toxin-antitoxin system RelE/ParE family toxin [Huaxiibacter chinensis]ANG91277.1 addiction module toxin RelE [Lelliottia amnigena]MCG5043749.1 type II toxin-antitoxin system RelE/ParE family toxin [Huaxiibacter chinensis]
MCEGRNPPIEVFQTRRFEKAMDKLSNDMLKTVEDEIDKIILDPLKGELKKGDLSYLRVHKFHIHKQLVLLGYSWKEQKLELYLLSLATHENFYKEMKQARKTDLLFIL